SEQQPRVYTNRVTCGSTKAGGWTTRPGLNIASAVGSPTPNNCDGCVQVDANGQTYQLALATDGAVLAMYSYRFTNLGLPTWSDIYRLSTGSTQWQKGGKLPEGAAFYAPRPDGGILWSMPATAPDGLGNLAGPVFTASYPGPAAAPLPTPAQQTPTPAGNVDQSAPLAWQPIANPTGFQPRLTSSNILAVAPSDGRTAYACAQPNADPPATQPRGWVTHNGGATWSTLPLPQVTGWCSMVVDEVDPRDLLLGISQDPPAGGSTIPDRYYRSTNGGTTWQRISGLDGSVVYQFATYGSAVYALRVENPLSDTATAELQASTDGMATWHAVDGAIRSGRTSVGQFWLNPYNGMLLATNVPPSTATTTSSTVVWRSGDGGAHWSDLKAPAYGFTSVIVQPPQANHAWVICVSDFTASPTTAPGNLLYCGDDSSQGWHDMTGLDIGDATATPHYVALTSDGALLAITMATTGAGATTYNVYRLPSGANRWQALGPTPEFSLLYAPTADGDGMLWSAPINGIVGVPVNGIGSDEQGRIFAVAAP
ncbi:MAG TPA: hypothetical protein VJO13_10295, partial [Ktedonobacterales bacterium]|nr:hypothetical protein [Ktedonobacterales bacterium]